MICFTHMDYDNIVESVIRSSSDENEYLDIEQSVNVKYLLCIRLFHEVIGCVAVGGTYEQYSEEKIYRVLDNKYTVMDWGFYDEEGECVECDFSIARLSDVLN